MGPWLRSEYLHPPYHGCLRVIPLLLNDKHREPPRSPHRSTLNFDISVFLWSYSKTMVNEQASSSSHNVTELPAPATNAPIERVTVASRVTLKDPKKVAAGRDGAAARMAKHEFLLETLRAAKESFRAPDDVTRERYSFCLATTGTGTV